MNSSPKAEVITIGDEILYGQINDTNSQWLGEQLSSIGIPLARKTTVGDSAEVIRNALQEASQRAEVIITTGGLGPTQDDVTKRTFAEFFGVQISRRPEVLTHIEQLLTNYGLSMDALNETQADLPENALAIMNHWGTAPGMWFEHNGKVWIAMPGVPREMKAMMRDFALPRLQKHFKTPFITHRMIRTVGIPESKLAPLLAEWEQQFPTNVKLAYLPRLAEVRLRLTAWGNSAQESLTLIDTQLRGFPPVARPYTYAFENEELEETIGKQLIAAQKTLAVAESCTGGLIANRITNIAGCSAYFLGGVVAYSNAVKESQLGVHSSTLEQFGAVSEETVREMAEGVRQRLQADCALAVTGIAGPGGATPHKPVGTIWIGYADQNGTQAKLLNLSKNRMANIQVTATLALNLLRQQLEAQAHSANPS